MSDVRLAWNWSKTRVLECLDNAQKDELIRFLRERYKERFFDPLRCLRKATGSRQGYGFAIMSLCCLLVETIECFRQGLPSSHDRELRDLERLQVNNKAPAGYRLQGPFNQINSRRVFEDFFERREHQRYFPRVDGDEFYKHIRCGLLHQAQTTNGWRIIRTGKFWDGSAKTINRDEFATRLEECFENYLKALLAAEWTK